MKIKLTFILGLLTSAFCFSACAQGTAFTYQGQLNAGALPADGTYDLTFALFNGNSGAGQVGSTLASAATAVSNGLFTVTLDFGANFPGADRWLEIAVRTNGGGAFTTLSPRQKITPTPYATTASNLSGQLSGAQIADGTVTAAKVDSTQVQLRVNGTAPAGQFITGIAANGGVSVSADSTDWKLNGNNVAPGQFLGSTNNQPLEIRVNNVRALRLEPDPRIGNDAANLVGGHPANQIELPDSGGSVIVGGGYAGGGNIIRSNSSGVFIGAGSVNVVGPNANDVVIAGGNGNQAKSFAAAIGGGYGNNISTNAPYAVIAGGNQNNARSGGATIGGGFLNVIETNAVYAVIAGGGDNVAKSYGATIGGGIQNQLGTNSAFSVIAGGNANTLESQTATIGGGVGNTNTGYAGTVAGGFFNTAANNGAAVGGGGQNIASGFNAVVAGGNNNIAAVENAAVGGGLQNTNRGYAASIGGGVWNQATNSFATVPGGVLNLAGGSQSFAAGSYAKALHAGAFVWSDATGTDFPSVANNEFAVRASGGVRFVTTGAGITLNSQPVLTAGSTNALTLNNPANAISGTFTGNGAGLTNLDAWRLGGNAGTTAGVNYLGTTDNQPLELSVNGMRGLRLEPSGGYVNVIGGFGNAVGFGVIGAVVAGGVSNTVTGSRAFIGGGSDNLVIAGSHQVLAGGQHNQVSGFYSSIGGGQDNVADEQWNVIGGGKANITTNAFSMTIAGGSQSRISSSHYGAIGGGWVNRILSGATGSVIGGGQLNLIDGAMDATISGGYGNSALGNGTTVSGGTNNLASASFSTVPGGRENSATADYAFAAGRRAKANHQGAFVWADSQNADFASTATNQFAVRAQNGVVIQAAPNGTALELRTGGAIKVTGAGLGTGTPVFIHRAVAATISGNTTTIDHPLSNNDPNAILIVTPNWNPAGGAGVYNPNPIGVYYTGTRWTIFNQNLVGMVTNSAYNVLVVKP